MSTTKPTSQSLLDAFGGRGSLPPLSDPDAPDRLACELCDTRDEIVYSNGRSTLCHECATSLSKLPPGEIPGAIAVLRHARRRMQEAVARSTRRRDPR